MAKKSHAVHAVGVNTKIGLVMFSDGEVGEFVDYLDAEMERAVFRENARYVAYQIGKRLCATEIEFIPEMAVH